MQQPKSQLFWTRTVKQLVSPHVMKSLSNGLRSNVRWLAHNVHLEIQAVQIKMIYVYNITQAGNNCAVNTLRFTFSK